LLSTLGRLKKATLVVISTDGMSSVTKQSLCYPMQT
jgi:hypothetical protein